MKGDKKMMMGIDEAVTYLHEHPSTDGMTDRISNRLQYVRAKEVGVKPRFHKGQYGKKYDHWTCRNCGATLAVSDNFCKNCGYAVLWDSTRCLTGVKDETAES